MSVSKRPLVEHLHGSFVKILSISVAVFEVNLVGREINGKNLSQVYIPVCHDIARFIFFKNSRDKRIKTANELL